MPTPPSPGPSSTWSPTPEKVCAAPPTRNGLCSMWRACSRVRSPNVRPSSRRKVERAAGSRSQGRGHTSCSPSMTPTSRSVPKRGSCTRTCARALVPWPAGRCRLTSEPQHRRRPETPLHHQTPARNPVSPPLTTEVASCGFLSLLPPQRWCWSWPQCRVTGPGLGAVLRRNRRDEAPTQSTNPGSRCHPHLHPKDCILRRPTSTRMTWSGTHWAFAQVGGVAPVSAATRNRVLRPTESLSWPARSVTRSASSRRSPMERSLVPAWSGSGRLEAHASRHSSRPYARPVIALDQR